MKMEDKMWRYLTLYIARIGRWGDDDRAASEPSAGTKQQMDFVARQGIRVRG